VAAVQPIECRWPQRSQSACRWARCEHDEGRSPSAGSGRGIAEVEHVVARGQGAPHFRAPHTSAAAVHDAHFEQATAAALVEVFPDHAHRVARRERVEVELAGDGELDRLPVLRRIVFVGQWLTRTSKDPELSA